MIDVAPHQLEIIQKLLAHHVPECEVRAFGSRVKWTAKDYSDLDIAIAGTGKLPEGKLADLREAFTESELPFRVDVIDWFLINKSFQKIIEERYEVIQQPRLVDSTSKQSKTNSGKLSMTATPQYTAVADLICDGVLIINDGYRAKNSELSKVGIPFARAGNINDGFNFQGADLVPPGTLAKVGNKRSKPGDVVFTSKGTVGRFAYVREDTPEFVYSPQLCFWRSGDTSRIDSRWLYYWMNGGEFFQQFKGVAGQTDMAEYVSLRDQRAMRITLPPLPEQKAIARILGTLDDKIELNRRMNATLEAMARALFKSWFIDFDPVRRNAARAQNQPSPAASRHPLPLGEGRGEEFVEELDKLFPATFHPSELGKIPEGWRVDSIYSVSDVIYGAPFASKLFNSDRNGMPLIRIRDLKDESPGVWTPEVHPKGYMVRHGDIVVGMDGEFRAYLWGGDEAWLNQRVCVFKSKHGCSATFVRNSIMRPLARVEATETATTVIHLGKNDIDRFKIIIPPTEILQSFATLSQHWYDQIVANKQQSRILATLRDTLLPKLLSGELNKKII